MSSNMAPVDNRNFFERIADAMYGQATPGNTTGWEPGAASAYFGDPTEPIGYYRFNTGNPTRDAIMSIAANELGLDNALRASLAREEGDWGEWAKQIGLAAGSLSLGGVSAKGLAATGRAFYQVARTPGFANRITTGIGTRVRNRGALGLLSAAGRGIGGATRTFTRSRGGRFGALLGLGSLASWGLMSRDEPALSAAEAALLREEEEAAASPESVDFVPRDAEAEATTKARVDIAGIQQQYTNILRELQGMYELAETEEEKERLRFMLADIEAQRDAGLKAIEDGYASTVAEIRKQAVLSGERTAERAIRYGAEIEAGAQRAAERMVLQNMMQQQDYRGLGSGSQQPVNEWVGLISAMAPAQQQYTQRLGDISREGMEWLANTTAAQGQAQSADLQRLAAATRSGTIARQQAQVSDRINRERELQRAAILDTLQRQASALQSAQQFNASDAASVGLAERADTIRQLTSAGYTPEYVQQYFAAAGLGGLDPSEMALARSGIISVPSLQNE